MPLREAMKEWKRQCIQAQREIEDSILRASIRPEATAYLKEVADQILDFRNAGHYTTLGDLPD